MPCAMTQGRDTPASTEIAPTFTQTGFPKTDTAILANLDKRKRDERSAQACARQQAHQQGKAPDPQTCHRSLHLSLFFDGTNNNREADLREPRSTSNIARLYHASIDHTVKSLESNENAPPKTPSVESHFRYYCPGVGTVFPDIGEYTPCQFGLIGANNGEFRINWGITRLVDMLQRVLTGLPLDDPQTLDLVKQMGTHWWLTEAFSNGRRNRENTMRPLMNELESKLLERKVQGKKPELLSIRLYVYGFSRGAAQARAFCNWLLELVRQPDASGTAPYRFAGLPISIEFLGLFDTVAAVGLADSVPFAAGHMAWAGGTMRLPDEDTRLPDDQRFLKRCVHLVSAHEQRASFPLDSIRRRERKADGSLDMDRPSRYRGNTIEYVYPGMHSDIGGGYPAGDQGKAMRSRDLLSQVTLHHMYKEAFDAGAPLQVLPDALTGELLALEPLLEINDEFKAEFNISEQIITRFNAWQAHASKTSKKLPLEAVVRNETELITGWRIARYHGGVKKTGFYGNITSDDEPKNIWKAKERLHEHRHDELARQRKGEEFVTCQTRLEANRAVSPGDCKGYTKTTIKGIVTFDNDLQLIGGLPAYKALNLEKAYEPMLDKRQLEGAAAEFSRDYLGQWGPVRDEISITEAVINAFSGIVYLINEEDEAEQFKSIHTNGTACHKALFTENGAILPGQELLVGLFDDHVHDSRAWFMNSSPMGARETWTDYFRYRLVHFDNESNKSMTPLLTASRVVGLAIAVSSIGLSVKRRDPRYLLGLILPTVAVPVIRGKLPMPGQPLQPSTPLISAFDPLTGIAYPMMSGIEKLRTYTREPGNALQAIDAMPAPQPLTAQTANTPELQAIFKAHQAAEAEAAQAKPPSLFNTVSGQLASATQSSATAPGWLEQAGNAIGKHIETS